MKLQYNFHVFFIIIALKWKFCINIVNYTRYFFFFYKFLHFISFTFLLFIIICTFITYFCFSYWLSCFLIINLINKFISDILIQKKHKSLIWKVITLCKTLLILFSLIFRNYIGINQRRFISKNISFLWL